MWTAWRCTPDSADVQDIDGVGKAPDGMKLRLKLPPAGSVFVVFGSKVRPTLPAWNASVPVEVARRMEIKGAVTNLWNNRLAGDRNLPREQRVTRLTQPVRFDKLLESGLLGPVGLSIVGGAGSRR